MGDRREVFHHMVTVHSKPPVGPAIEEE